jgi:two-component system sensor histidine kinase UhpB
MPLFWKSFLANAVTLSVAVLALALSPATVSHPLSTREAVVLGAGVVALSIVNWWLVRRVLQPLDRLRVALDSLSSPDAGARVDTDGPVEIAVLGTAYNAMLDRLDAERDNTVRQALNAQEEERRRVSSELHDEVGQALTGLLLRLSALAELVPTAARSEVENARESVRSTLHEVRSISARLRPGVLHELGLLAALRGLAHGVEDSTGLRVHLSLPSACELSPETELVIYRVMQESLTNVVRHADATTATVSLSADEHELVLVVADDGIGRLGPAGTGLQGMHERARLLRARLVVDSVVDQGVTVTLRVPTENAVIPEV